MPIPRRVLIMIVGAATAAGVLYIRNRMQPRHEEKKPDAPPVPDNEARPWGTETTPSTSTSPHTSSGSTSELPGAVRELGQFLAGESWYDEHGWRGLWQREGIEAPQGWL